MTPALKALLLIHAASEATKQAHDALVELGLHDAATLMHHHGEAIAMAAGKVVKQEAERRAAEAVPS